MTTNEFVWGVKARAVDSAVANTISDLRQPSGKHPSAQAASLSTWYAGLTPDDRKMLEEIIRTSADKAVFGLLCILDGARVIEDGPDKGDFELYFVKGGAKTLVNPSENPLHEAYRASNPKSG